MAASDAAASGAAASGLADTEAAAQGAADSLAGSDTHQADTDLGDPREQPETPTTRQRTRRARKPARKFKPWKEIPIVVVLALVLAVLLQSFVARSFNIPSASMELTLIGHNNVGDHILVDKVVYDFRAPHPGEVVVFRGPPGWDRSEARAPSGGGWFTHLLRQLGSEVGLAQPDEYDLVKRVIAVGGQTVSCCDAQNRVLVDGKPLAEPYLYFQPGVPNQTVPNDPQGGHFYGAIGKQASFPPLRVPKGMLFVMGDNRNNSDDSRYQNGGGLGGLVPVANVIGKARLIIWPISRWQGVSDVNPQSAG
ncbi:MAG: signal peptidase I [Sciscionella sp.]